MVKLSKKFVVRLKLNELPAYRIAQQAKVNPSFISKIVNGIEPVRLDDVRIHHVAEVLGLDKEEAFEIEELDRS